MSFRWPLALLALLIVPLLLAIYIWQLRRKRRGAVRFSSVALVRAAMPKSASWRRHVPPALFLLGLTSLGVATARPTATAKVPVSRTSIVLALDVSRSMCSTDVEPNRLAAAQDAAREFVKAQPKGTRIAIVAFNGFASVVVEPTTEKEQLTKAIDALITGRGTVIGSAILRSLDTVAGINADVAPVDPTVEANATDSFGGGFDPSAGAPSTEVVPPAPEPKEGYIPDIVVVLTDGANTRGITPIDAAKQAATRRVRVYTIGFGTTNPSGGMVCTAEQLGSDAFAGDPAFGGGLPGAGGNFGNGGGGFGGGGGFRRFLLADYPTLQSVANMTGGKFYKAEDADQLKGVFAKLPKDVTLQKRKVELSVGFLMAGAALATLAMALSLRWNRTP